MPMPMHCFEYKLKMRRLNERIYYYETVVRKII